MQVRAALASKVSRERFGTELEGMMSGVSLQVHSQAYPPSASSGSVQCSSLVMQDSNGMMSHDMACPCWACAFTCRKGCMTYLADVSELCPICHAGPDPVRAVRDIQRLSLFPIVFSVGPVMSAALGDSYGEQCSSVMAAAEALLQEHSTQASPCSYWWQHESRSDRGMHDLTTCMLQCLLLIRYTCLLLMPVPQLFLTSGQESEASASGSLGTYIRF